MTLVFIQITSAYSTAKTPINNQLTHLIKQPQHKTDELKSKQTIGNDITKKNVLFLYINKNLTLILLS